MTTWKEGRRMGRKGGQGQETRENIRARELGGAKKPPFIVGGVTWLLPGNGGWGKPGCSQVTVGVESSQNTRGLALCD